MVFVITGFGPFCGVDSNPTTRLIELLEEEREAERTPGILAHVRTQLLRVSAKEVREFVDTDLFPRQQCGVQPFVAVHLGVDAKADCLKLEWQAFNEANFRVPDEDGWQPRHEAIEDSPERPLGTRLVTHLPIPSLLRTLKKYPVRASCDAGRFVCNWTYYLSLLHSLHHTKLPHSKDPAAAMGGGAGPAPTATAAVVTAAANAAGSLGGSSCSRRTVEASSASLSGTEWAAAAEPPLAADQPGKQQPQPEQDCTAGPAADHLRPPPPQLQQQGQPSSSDGGSSGPPLLRYYSLFVHVPPFSVVPERVQFEFLLDLLHALRRCVEAGEEAGEAELAQVAAGDGGSLADAQLGGAAAASAAAAEGSEEEEDVVMIERPGDAVAAAVCALPGSAQPPQPGRRTHWQLARLLSCKLQ